MKENVEKIVKNSIMKREKHKKMGILTMGGSGMRNSIGKKVVGMIMLLGLLMVGICVANMSAFSIITGLNKEVIMKLQSMRQRHRMQMLLIWRKCRKV